MGVSRFQTNFITLKIILQIKIEPKPKLVLKQEKKYKS